MTKQAQRIIPLGAEALGDSMKNMVGLPIDDSTIQTIKGSSEGTLQGLVDEGTLNSFDVGAALARAL